jgi:hypothetical protein
MPCRQAFQNKDAGAAARIQPSRGMPLRRGRLPCNLNPDPLERRGCMFPSNGSTAALDRAHRLLHGMHQVCSHDLPNQSVALESLLHLFVMDEADQLSPQAREYLQRLQSVAHKIAGMAQYLRDLIRLERHQPDVGEIAFERLVNDLKAELGRQLPEHSFTWNTQFAVASAVADRRLVVPAAIALVHGAAEALGATDLHLTLRTSAPPTSATPTSAQPGGGPALRLTVAPPREAGSAQASPASNTDRRLEFALGVELLALANIDCRRYDAAGAIAFVLAFPS